MYGKAIVSWACTWGQRHPGKSTSGMSLLKRSQCDLIPVSNYSQLLSFLNRHYKTVSLKRHEMNSYGYYTRRENFKRLAGRNRKHNTPIKIYWESRYRCQYSKCFLNTFSVCYKDLCFGRYVQHNWFVPRSIIRCPWVICLSYAHEQLSVYSGVWSFEIECLLSTAHPEFIT